eukprot:GHVU01177199.1.p1 GENE.GHVU01177199.1~~GHVU01177199.1.p1  ORF type:complete len:348 (+),score=36.45 GHVU01177199.1:111-1154(+)
MWKNGRRKSVLIYALYFLAVIVADILLFRGSHLTRVLSSERPGEVVKGALFPEEASEGLLKMARFRSVPRDKRAAEDGGFTDGITLATVCVPKHFDQVPQLLDSIARQTMHAHQTLIILSSPTPDNLTQSVAKLARNHPGVNADVQVRIGKFNPAQNRDYALTISNNDVVSFIDCDDLMHPQRNEVLLRMFNQHKDLNALFHDFIFWKTNKTTKWDYSRYKSINLSDPKLFDLPVSYAEIYNDPVVQEPFQKRRWNASDMMTEPNHRTKDSIWYFPKDIRAIKKARLPMMCANGHITVRRSSVSDIPMSYMVWRYGEDSVYSWRLLHMRKNVTLFNWKLSTYIKRDM